MKVCTFCNTPSNQVASGKNGEVLCLTCAEVAIRMIKPKSIIVPKENIEIKNIEPKSLKEQLDKHIIDQEDAKKSLSVAMYNHILRINNLDKPISKSNIMLLGPTGTGKTFLAETIAKEIGIPLVVVNTTSLTAAGYIGEDVSSVLERLWKASGEDVQKAEKGVIFLDEIDKITTAGGGTNNKDVSGKAVQQELLKILEGDIVRFYPDSNSHNTKGGDVVEINTKDILFIAGGAFVDLHKSKGVRINALGEVNELEKLSSVMIQEKLRKYGMISEFIGRFPNIVELQALTLDSMKLILTNTKNSLINQYVELFKLSDVSLEFEDTFIDNIATKSMSIGTGARGLKTIMEENLTDIMYNISSYKGKKISISYDNKVIIKEV